MPEIPVVLSGESSIRLTIQLTILVYVALSALIPAGDNELKADAAITKACLFLSSSPLALAHALILCIRYACVSKKSSRLLAFAHTSMI